MATYEEKKDIIDELLAIRRKSWKDRVSSKMVSSYMGYDDVCQIIRIHFYKKIGQYDSKQPFERWANRIITRQFTNIAQKNYGKFAPPCISKPCPWNLGANVCGKTESRTQCSECPLYAKWERKKQSGYNIHFATSIETEGFIHHQSDVEVPQSCDEEETRLKFHSQMLITLPERLRQFYQWIYVEKVSEDQLALLMGLKTNENGRRPGYRQIQNIKKDLERRGRLMLDDFDLVKNDYGT